MASGKDDPVRTQRLNAFFIKVVVRHNVIGNAFGLKPVDQAKIGRQLVRAVVERSSCSGPDADWHGTQHADHADSAAIAVAVIKAVQVMT
jgi:hypothetical protein